MKSFIILASLLCFSHDATSQNVNFDQGTWEEVLQKAKAENKYIMVDAFTTWCGPCKRMDAEKFHNNQEVADFLNTNFISFKADCEKSPTAAMAIKFKVMSYPTLLFFNPQGELISRSLGYTSNQKVFMEPFQKALAIKDKKVFAYDSKELNPGFPPIYTDAFKVDGVNAKRHSAEEVLQYLDGQKDKFSEVNWAVLYLYSFPGRYEQFFIDNYEKYKTLYKTETADAVGKIANRHVNAAMNNKDEKELDAAMAMVQKYIPEQSDDLLPGWKINFYKSNGQWVKYADAIDAELANDPDVDVEYLNQFCWPVYEKCDDPAIIKRALGWLDSRYAELKSYEVLDTYASLLYKGNRLEEAEQYALKAIKQGEDDDRNVNDTKELLVKIRSAKAGGSGK
ncbi:MAG: thioredoxin fold domain-containing protein [Chitinophagales bacterium]